MPQKNRQEQSVSGATWDVRRSSNISRSIVHWHLRRLCGQRIPLHPIFRWLTEEPPPSSSSSTCSVSGFLVTVTFDPILRWRTEENLPTHSVSGFLFTVMFDPILRWLTDEIPPHVPPADSSSPWRSALIPDGSRKKFPRHGFLFTLAFSPSSDGSRKKFPPHVRPFLFTLAFDIFYAQEIPPRNMCSEVVRPKL